jgi:Protein of unknown function (DUF2786)
MGNGNRDTELRILEAVRAAWRSGWQPRELVRQIRRTCGAPELALALLAIAADHRGRDATTIDSRWVAQIAELDLATGGRAGWLGDWMRDVPLQHDDQRRAVAVLLRNFSGLTPIAILIPPPGTRPSDSAAVNLTTKTNDPVLDRVRALLAQAESTQYEAEAETFTAKAQELMTRHAIDMAMVAAGTTRSDRPDTIRIPIDDPYVDAKSMLLHVVAKSSRCRAVSHQGYAMSSVVGFASDLDATQTLFTSLLVQAQLSLQAASASAPAGTRTRSRRFRSAFLLAYASRVGQRLDEINRSVVADAEAETGRSILPVLAARSARVDTTISEMFGPLGRPPRRRDVDAAGWASGVVAADRARLNSGDLEPAR